VAGLAHLGIGLMFTLLTPDIPVFILIGCAYLLDILFFGFLMLGLESLPKAERIAEAPWSHSLFMALVWSLLAGLIAFLFTQTPFTSIIIGLLVFSHWIIDFIVSPMTYAFPNDTGKLLHPFGGSIKVGLGAMKTKIGVVVIEGGFILIGVAVFISTFL
jgi:hypothetical protein